MFYLTFMKSLAIILVLIHSWQYLGEYSQTHPFLIIRTLPDWRFLNENNHRRAANSLMPKTCIRMSFSIDFKESTSSVALIVVGWLSLTWEHKGFAILTIENVIEFRMIITITIVLILVLVNLATKSLQRTVTTIKLHY